MGDRTARNVELKARVADPQMVIDTAQRLATSPAQRLRQVDTYFNGSHGRLKLREIWTVEQAAQAQSFSEMQTQPHRVELIWYDRPDTTEPKTSRYIQAPVTSPPLALKQALTHALGLRAVVDKLRTVWLWHNVRIHLDDVTRLGTFLEFEAVLPEDAGTAEGERQVATLMNEFRLQPHDLVSVSYIDLILQQAP